MANKPAENINSAYSGRKIIYTAYDSITADNIIEVLTEALNIHALNRQQINYLWNYYKGVQPILSRIKNVNSEITNRIVENHAYEIVTFQNGYLLGSPIQYVSRGDGHDEEISLLNKYMDAEGKASDDVQMGVWMHVCGTSYRMALPDEEPEADDIPFELFVLDPRTTFVVYSSDIAHKPLLAATIVRNADGQNVYSCYTKNHFWKIVEDQIVESRQTLLKELPIIEYPLNPERMGAFERVLPLLDAINQTASDRQDGIDQFVQALLVFKNVDINVEQFNEIRELGGLKISDITPDRRADVEYITNELNQSQTQTLIDHEYETVLRICGIPNRNMQKGGTSDNGVAVELRDGWSAAETHAKATELMFKEAEKLFLKLVLGICRRVSSELNMRESDVDIRFTRRNYDNILTKSQTLITMLASDKIHPRLAFEHSGMFIDPELAYQESMRWFEEHQSDDESEGSADADNSEGSGNYTDYRQDSVGTSESGRA